MNDEIGTTLNITLSLFPFLPVSSTVIGTTYFQRDNQFIHFINQALIPPSFFDVATFITTNCGSDQPVTPNSVTIISDTDVANGGICTLTASRLVEVPTTTTLSITIQIIIILLLLWSDFYPRQCKKRESVARENTT